MIPLPAWLIRMTGEHKSPDEVIRILKKVKTWLRREYQTGRGGTVLPDISILPNAKSDPNFQFSGTRMSIRHVDEPALHHLAGIYNESFFRGTA